MQTKWFFGIGIVATAIASIYFVAKLNLSFAVLSMLALFTLTNSFRFVTFRRQGAIRESKWMLWMSVFFGMAFVIILIITLMK